MKYERTQKGLPYSWYVQYLRWDPSVLKVANDSAWSLMFEVLLLEVGKGIRYSASYCQ